MVRTLCVANQKGGVGKTTTAVNLAAGLARAGQRTLLIDLDPQCTATMGLGLSPSPRHSFLADSAAHTPRRTYAENLLLMPGSRHVADVDRLAGGEREELRSWLQEQKDGFTYLVIDSPPSLGRLTETALVLADEILMPVQCEYFAMEGLTQMIEVIRGVMRQPAQQLDFAGILLTMVDDASELTQEVEREVREFFGEIVFDTVIPRDWAVSEAPQYGKAVIDHAPRARGARAYIELCMEVLER